MARQASDSASHDAQVREWLSAYSGESVTVAELLCDRFAGDGEKVALYYEDGEGREEELTFARLRELSALFAGVLRELGVDKGDRVATLLPKSPELMIALLGIWRLGAVHVPLFTALGPDAVGYRLDDSGAKAVVTNEAYREKVGEDGEVRVVVVGEASGEDVSFEEALRSAEPVREPVSISGEDPVVQLYTSGTEGNPKGVAVPAWALAAFEAYMRLGLDLREDDFYWNVADPGWAYGLYYGVIGPFLLGKSTLWVNAPFDPENVYRVVQKYGVTNLAAAPTAYRALRAAVEGETEGLGLRVASSAGEPLNPGVIEWAEQTLGIEIRDHYGQTELGMVINNHHHPDLALPLRPGSMGQAMPGFKAVLVDENANELGPGEEGQVAIDTKNSPLSWFGGYYRDPERTSERFSEDERYYFTGDSATQDEDGFYFFSGRGDDIILSAGYRIGPFEVESALTSHPAVAEAAVVGKPDELRGEVVVAFVVPTGEHQPSEELAEELQEHVKSNLAAHAYPREVHFLEELPKTPSGKIQRFLLRSEVEQDD
ncbi:MAG: AMP-binding protein [Rubrobacter sp.]|nr:AMP-binding protein [Rubrobacter sp.]